jgi:hypothetical protein
MTGGSVDGSAVLTLIAAMRTLGGAPEAALAWPAARQDGTTHQSLITANGNQGEGVRTGIHLETDHRPLLRLEAGGGAQVCGKCPLGASHGWMSESSSTRRGLCA